MRSDLTYLVSAAIVAAESKVTDINQEQVPLFSLSHEDNSQWYGLEWKSGACEV